MSVPDAPRSARDGALARRLGVAALALAPGPALLAAHGWLRHPVAPTYVGAWERDARLWLPMGALLLFALGWVLAGAAVRARGSRRLGALGGAALYLLAGFAWWTAVAVRRGDEPAAPWVAVARDPLALLHVCQWPGHAADAPGLMGFHLG